MPCTPASSTSPRPAPSGGVLPGRPEVAWHASGSYSACSTGPGSPVGSPRPAASDPCDPRSLEARCSTCTGRRRATAAACGSGSLESAACPSTASWPLALATWACVPTPVPQPPMPDLPDYPSAYPTSTVVMMSVRRAQEFAFEVFCRQIGHWQLTTGASIWPLTAGNWPVVQPQSKLPATVVQLFHESSAICVTSVSFGHSLALLELAFETTLQTTLLHCS